MESASERAVGAADMERTPNLVYSAHTVIYFSFFFSLLFSVYNVLLAQFIVVY